MKVRNWFTVVFGLAAAFTASAQGPDTLEKIKQSGSITLGFRESSIPFSYVMGGSSTDRPVGFNLDVCDKVVEAIKTRLQLPNLKVAYQNANASSRLPLVQNGTIDLDCGTTTNTIARQQQVGFSLNYFAVNVTAAVKKSAKIESLADLNGKTIVSTTGSTAIPLLRGLKRTENIQAQEVYGKDHYESFLILQSGRADAFILDDVLLAGVIAQSNAPQDFRLLSESLRQEPYGFTFRKGDTEFKALVDGVLRGLMSSGQMLPIYEKWFQKPIPPKGVTLNFAPTDVIRDLYKNPSDKGI